MSIKFKFLFSFLVISFVTLVFSVLVSNYIQVNSNKTFHEVAEKSLPGSIALARMATEFYRVEFLLGIYESNPTDEVRVDIEKALASLGENQITHMLFHEDLDEQDLIISIANKYNRLVAQYLLALQNKKDGTQLDLLRSQLQKMVEKFTYVVTPHIDKDIKNSFLEVSSLQQVYKNSSIMLWSYFVAVTVLLIMLSIYFSNLVSGPLHRFVKLIERYGHGENVHFDPNCRLPKELQELKNVLQFSIEKRIEAEQLLCHQANHDALTDLPNRYLAIDRLNQLIHEARRNRSLLAVMFIDLDDFKKFNDSLGHGIGDKILISIARRLSSGVRAEDTIGRLGGDEFIGIFGNLSSIIDAQPLAETISSIFQRPFVIDDRSFNISASIGISFYPDDGSNSTELLKKADTAMYYSKVSGKNIYSFHSEEMYENVKRRLEVEENLVRALERDEFHLVFQPKYSTNPTQVEGFEALLRWKSPKLGEVSPEEFIPVAEQSGLIIAIGKCVIDEALKFITQINARFQRNYTIAVNFSPAQFRENDFVDNIKEQLQRYRLDSKLFEVEITENLLLQENQKIFDTLNELSSMNIRVSMDDFGTGYSSLNYIRRFPFAVVKIDRNFISDLETSKSDQELVIATILMAHALDLEVVAEGVETEWQLQFLTKHDCDVVQGYLFSQPLSAAEIVSYIGSIDAEVSLSNA